MVQKGSLMADNTIPFPTKGNFNKNLKADAFESYLKKEGLNFFRRQDAHDSYDTVVFMTALPAGKHRLVCAVITDNSMYTLIRVHLGTAPKGPARKTFVPFLNKLNGEHAIVKYTIGSDDNVFLDVCVTSTNDFKEIRIFHTSRLPFCRRLPLRGRSILRLWRGPSPRACSDSEKIEFPITSH